MEFSVPSSRKRCPAMRFSALFAVTSFWGSSGAFCTPPWRPLPLALLPCQRHEWRHAVAVRLDRGDLSYYSFITLATVGYGDVTPITPLARTLAWMEAITGQFYLAILVAGLVGFKVTQAMRHESTTPIGRGSFVEMIPNPAASQSNAARRTAETTPGGAEGE